MLRFAEKIHRMPRLYRFARRLFRKLRLLKRKSGRVNGRIVEDYYQEQSVRKLHIGCGDNILEDWLNSDYHPSSPCIFHLDATKPFPIESNTFNYVFTEHMVEHISFLQGLGFLNECYRILSENGKIRVSTPSLSFLIDLYTDKKSKLQEQYLTWALGTFVKEAPNNHATFVINNFMRDWGHMFIYDEETLRESLEKAGFSRIVKCELNDSDDKELQNLENEKRMPADFLKLESITLEATKVVDKEQDLLPMNNHRFVGHETELRLEELNELEEESEELVASYSVLTGSGL